jgi:hypothetical protein
MQRQSCTECAMHFKLRSASARHILGRAHPRSKRCPAVLHAVTQCCSRLLHDGPVPQQQSVWQGRVALPPPPATHLCDRVGSPCPPSHSLV